MHLQGGWFLKRRVMVNAEAGTTVMTPIGIFASAEQAAEAVADGTTGEIDWDATERALPRKAYLLPAWKVEPPYDSSTPWQNR